MAIDPISLSISVGLGLYQIASANEQAEMIRQQAEFNRRIALMNAEFAEQDAFEAEQYGYSRAARYQAVIDRVSAEQKAAFTQQGVDTTFGTAAAVQKETELVGFLNQMDLVREGQERAYGLKRQASNYRLQGAAGVFQAQSDAASTAAAGSIRAIGTFAQGAQQSGLTGYASKYASQAGDYVSQTGTDIYNYFQPTRSSYGKYYERY